ncbi:MAG: alpha-ketoacid dehydrogenase subunit beta, partial [Chloroflexi bacterium]|nr:alpha-ketoacid dehydrogenase subunit beta [Chloroflexota bacterium]
QGIEAEVIDLRSLRPLDIETSVKSVEKTGRAVVVEENWKTGGFGAEISSSLQENVFDYLESPIIRICGEEVPMPYNQKLESIVIPNSNRVVREIKGMLEV